MTLLRRCICTHSCFFFLFFFLMIRRPPRSTLFPTRRSSDLPGRLPRAVTTTGPAPARGRTPAVVLGLGINGDRKSTRLNSSHTVISYAVFCLKKKKKKKKNKKETIHR